MPDFDLEPFRARWSAAHHDESQVRALTDGEAREMLSIAIYDIHELMREVERLRAARGAA